jgi:simple sugar transport system ATP-binding protein/ribose transport system ATP-binding protein
MGLATAGEPAPLLDCREIGRTFGSTVALDGVTVAFRAGSVHALVGENGAGKSTLGKIITGVTAPDRGSLVLRGTPVSFRSPRQALEGGIALVAQELALVPRLTVEQNVFLGVEPKRAGFVDRRALASRYRALAAESGFDLPGDAIAGRLPIARQQQVEIMRALAREAEMIVLDEPTAALSGAEVDKLHAVIRALAAAGKTVVLVSHFLGEVLALADTVTILRDGRLVRTAPAADETEATLIAGMLGRSATATYPEQQVPGESAAAVLTVQDLVAPGVAGMSFEVRAGEIVGFAGLVGAGRSEMARAIYGAAPVQAGSVVLVGADAWRDPRGAIARGIAMIPESRKTEGLMLGRPVRENVSLTAVPALSRLGFLRRGEERQVVDGALARTTATARPEQPAGSLSGGNQQKLLFARALLTKPRLIIADEPTRGVDIGAKAAVYRLLTDLAAEGAGVILISSELEEVLGLAHRILVVREGRIVRELAGAARTEDAILAAAFGTDAAAVLGGHAGGAAA